MNSRFAKNHKKVQEQKWLKKWTILKNLKGKKNKLKKNQISALFSTQRPPDVKIIFQDVFQQKFRKFENWWNHYITCSLDPTTSKSCLFSYCCSKSHNLLRFIISSFLEIWSFQTPARKMESDSRTQSLRNHDEITQETVENLMFISQNSSKVCSNLPRKWFENASYLYLSFFFINISRMKGNIFYKIITLKFKSLKFFGYS